MKQTVYPMLMPKDDPVFLEIDRRALNLYPSRVAFARALGLRNEQTYNNWRKRGIPDKHRVREKIADLLGLDRDALIFETRVIACEDVQEQPQGYNIGPGPRLKGDVPLISWVQAGAFHEADDPYPPGDAEDYMLCSSSHGPRAYALRVEGDSMTAPPGGRNTFPDGIIIFVDPDQAVENRQFAIARVEGENLVTFKQYVTDGGRHYLKPLNPQYDLIDQPFRILGKVIAAYFET